MAPTPEEGLGREIAFRGCQLYGAHQFGKRNMS